MTTRAKYADAGEAGRQLLGFEVSLVGALGIAGQDREDRVSH